MGGVSIWHWIVVLGIFVPYFWGASRILRRMGYSGWWSLVGLVWPINVIALIMLSYAPWPVEERPQA